eukprot:m.312512 g.312512  ORF g.312512 m.312512 type:complete len:391 (+) comp55390_c0_seq1:1120-2292(+)
MLLLFLFVYSFLSSFLARVLPFVFALDLHLQACNKSFLNWRRMQWWIVVVCALAAAARAEFSFYQNLTANGGGDAEYFVVGNTSYLSVANMNGNTLEIFELVDSYWQPLWSFPCENCMGSTHFILDEELYLAVSAYNAAASNLLKWDTETSTFAVYQQLHLTQCRKFKFASQGNDNLLAVALNSNMSVVFAWDSVNQLFVARQNISFSNSVDLSFLHISYRLFLAIGNGDTNASKVYEWNGSLFTFFQALPQVINAHDTYGYRLGSQTMLAVPTFDSGTYIFQWSAALNMFTLLQLIEGPYEYNVAVPFSVGANQYLAIGSVAWPEYYLPVISTIYEWSGSQYTPYQNITMWCSQSFEFWTINGTTYMATLNAMDGNNWQIPAQVFEWVN